MTDYNNIDDKKIITAEAPWNLTGKGYMLIYRFSKKEIAEDKFLSEKFKSSFRGGFGALMAVDYETSNAGPYGELLFIPGKFQYGKNIKHTISKIYVSTMNSVYNGKKNWAIPKEHADFTFTKIDEEHDQIEFKQHKKTFFSMKIKPGFLKFPLNTALLPFPLVQEFGKKAYYTKFSGSGYGTIARVKHITVDPLKFPALSCKKPLLAVKIEPFKIHFPKAVIEDQQQSSLSFFN